MAKLKKIPFQVSNEAKEGKHILTLSGVIQKRYWSDDKYIDAKLVRDALEGITNEVVIYLNSNGGDVFQGVEMYNYLKNHPSKITVEVTGVAASAATFLVAGADEVIMDTGTTMMIHEASTYVWGNKGDIQKTLKELEAVDESIMNIYIEKTGQTAEQITQWMEDEKWFTAQEAVDYGFADRVKTESVNSDQENMKALIDEAVAMALAKHRSDPGTAGQVPQKSLLNKLRKEVE